MGDTAEEERARPRSGWGWTLAAALVLIVAGFVAMLHPIATSLATGLVLGFAMILGGAFAIAAGFENDGRDRWLYVLLGIAGLLIGLLVLLFPFAGLVSIVWIIGAWLIAGGLFELLAAFRRGRQRLWLVLIGLLDLALGVLLIVMDPISALFFLAIAVGLSFVLRGVGLLILALRLRRSG